ncbi:MAG TPA: ubiquinone/menaquinone biosynthesis methyltransferase [Candidatus Tectomicrobia bacterium]|nr:ubiquinone/menaquinone biosynthesis methyltransferase [Candidatus Tectomicrobia bacterium]
MLSPSAIQRMFQYLAPRYDLWNRLASFYLDEYWRRAAVNLIPPGSRVLDLCTGTGELAVKMLPRLGAKGQVVGLDFAANMLTVASQKTRSLLQSHSATAAYVLGDAAALPFPSDTFDCLTNGFAMRNMLPSADLVLREMWRVLRPEGRVIILDICRPHSAVLTRLYRWHLEWVLPIQARLLYHSGQPFQYLRDSIMEFPPPPEFCARLATHGFTTVTFRPMSAGIVGIFTGIKGPRETFTFTSQPRRPEDERQDDLPSSAGRGSA